MDTVLIIIALILLVLAAFNVKIGAVNLGWLGLAFYVATALTP